jgi:chemotaxis family two-component system response regulator Rcp1
MERQLLHNNPSNRSLNLLLVEDSPADAMLMESVLEEVGGEFQLNVAHNGEEAIQHLLRHAATEADRPDLILLDLNLPRMNGHDVLKFLKADLLLQSIPVIVLSGSESPADIALAYRQGASSYLTKPSDIDRTVEMVRAIKRYWLDFVRLPSFA